MTSMNTSFCRPADNLNRGTETLTGGIESLQLGSDGCKKVLKNPIVWMDLEMTGQLPHGS